MKPLFRTTITAISLILIWHLIVIIFKLPPYILPTPLLVLKSFKLYSILILQQSIPTMIEATAGFILSFLLGTFGALILIYFRPIRLWFLPILLISQALPTFAIAPLLVIWFGYGMAAKIVTTIFMLFFPITSSFYDGLRRTPQEYLDLAKTMNAKKFQLLKKIRIPFALPQLASGLRVAATFAPMGAVIGEWVGSSNGLGFLILNANSRMQIDLMFAALFVLVVLTLLFYFAVNSLMKYLISWDVNNEKNN
jgi:putative hydroxymethylpyrimidine transport system permease protein